jgi:RND family efflux transporter MFP subunit
MISRTIGLGMLACVLLLPDSAPGDDRPKAKVPTVTVARPVIREVSDFVDLTGRVEAASSVVVRPRVTGELSKVAFKEGDTVKKGDLLFEIDPRLYQAEANKVNADLELAEARLKRVSADLERMKKLLAARAMSKEEYDAALCAVTEAKSAVQAARAAGDITRLRLAFTKVTAPITGKITRPLLTVGNLIQADQTRLATIYSVDPMLVAFEVDERTILSLLRLKRERQQPAMPIRMGLAGEEGFPHRGKVDSTGIHVDPQSGTVRCTASFTNEDGVLLPGMFARVRVTTSAPHDALFVSEEALYLHGGKRSDAGKAVAVVNAKNSVELRRVTLGRSDGSLREVTAGLKAQDRVIVNWTKDAPIGSTVEVKEVRMPVDEDGKKGERGK